MSIRIEIAMNYNKKLNLRIGDLDGSIESRNFTKEEVLTEISKEIDELIKHPSFLGGYMEKVPKEIKEYQNE